MKSTYAVSIIAGLSLGLAGAAESTVQFTPGPVGPLTQPVITSIYVQGTNLAIQASVPAGFGKITLEGSQRRAGAPAWVPKAVARTDGAAGELLVRLTQSSEVELLRLEASAADGLPDFFYQGSTEFAAQILDGAGALRGGTFPSGIVPGNGVFAFDSTGVGEGGIGVPREVVESDIWKVRGDTLYFFNQYRGLQVIDLSHADAPALLGSLPLSAAGEQMYVLDDTHVVLLVRNDCGVEGFPQSQILLVEVGAGKQTVVASLPVTGTIAESRLVGTALYVASHTYLAVDSANGTSWEWGTQISSFDLSHPAVPAARSTRWVPASYNSAVLATDRFLFVADNNVNYDTSIRAWRSSISIFDISNPDGTFSLVSTVAPYGQVKDKFKMNLTGEVLSVVSEQSGISTFVETFSLADPARPVKLGALKLVQGETLYATRFASNLLYAVTFQRIDPLWVIDLSDPAHPKVAGELQVPGVSSYLYPWGDRLVAIGWDNASRAPVTVSLFDVHDSSRPALLSRVGIGEGYAYSEANYDEKAFGVLPEAGLVLVPFTGYSDGQTFKGVQLIDLSHDSLALRGRIEHNMEARRATLHGERLISISGRELLSVDATDRDHPVVRSSLVLSWPVDRVFVSGDHLIEIERGLSGNSSPQIRVTRIESPDEVVGRLGLGELPYLGAALKNDRLYVAQGRPAEISWEWDPKNNTNYPISTNLGQFSLSIIDVSRLPALSLSGQTKTLTSQEFWGDWVALWPNPDLVVWKSAGYSVLPLDILIPINGLVLTPGYGGAVTTSPYGFGVGISAPLNLFAPWWGWNQPTKLIAFQVSDDSAPQFASELALDSGYSWGGAARAFAAADLVYASHCEFETAITRTNYSVVTNYDHRSSAGGGDRHERGSGPPLQSGHQLRDHHKPGPACCSQSGRADRLAATRSIAGERRSCRRRLSRPARGPSGATWSWGANSSGQLGDGSDIVFRSQIKPIVGVEAIRCVSAGYQHSLAVKSDGTVWSWGACYYGELGIGLPSPAPNQPPMPFVGSLTPVQAIGVSDAISVAAGAHHSLALTSNGEVWSWGANDVGQLGNGTYQMRTIPGTVRGLSHVQGLAAGKDHSLAVLADGSVWAWGNNHFGQLGNPNLVPSNLPLPVDGLSDVRAVSAGYWHSMALKADGTVWGWGRGDLGQLGSAATGTTNCEPLRIEGLTDIVELCCGSAHNVALKSDGTVWTWGANNHGQLGTTEADAGSPALVWGLNKAVAIGAGGAFSLAWTEDGVLWAWGSSDFGQLGAGLPTFATNLVVKTNVSMILTYDNVTNILQKTNYNYLTHQVLVTNEWPVYSTLEHDFLDVVDYTRPADPVVRPPVSLPGALQGISHEGALLYTVARRALDTQSDDFAQWLDASVYDGVEAHLVDSVAFPRQSSLPLATRDATIFVQRIVKETDPAFALEAWSLSNSGRFTRLAEVPFSGAADTLAVFSDLLAAQTAAGLQLFDVSAPARIDPVGAGAPAGCTYYNLDNADGLLPGGLWLPLGDYGVQWIGEFQPSSP